MLVLVDVKHSRGAAAPRRRAAVRAAILGLAAGLGCPMLAGHAAAAQAAAAPTSQAAPSAQQASAAAKTDTVELDSNSFGGLQARAIGPAATGGRIAAIDAVAEEPLTVYVGAAGGGVWRSRDGGTTFRPVFDEQTQSIGAIAVDPRSPKTVWVGTGESWTRNSVSVGDGVYRSTDGGDHWERMGLEKSERIARLQVDPADGNVVYA